MCQQTASEQGKGGEKTFAGSRLAPGCSMSVHGKGVRSALDVYRAPVAIELQLIISACLELALQYPNRPGSIPNLEHDSISYKMFICIKQTCLRVLTVKHKQEMLCYLGQHNWVPTSTCKMPGEIFAGHPLFFQPQNRRCPEGLLTLASHGQ